MRINLRYLKEYCEETDNTKFPYTPHLKKSVFDIYKMNPDLEDESKINYKDYKEEDEVLEPLYQFRKSLDKIIQEVKDILHNNKADVDKVNKSIENLNESLKLFNDSLEKKKVLNEYLNEENTSSIKIKSESNSDLENLTNPNEKSFLSATKTESPDEISNSHKIPKDIQYIKKNIHEFQENILNEESFFSGDKTESPDDISNLHKIPKDTQAIKKNINEFQEDIINEKIFNEIEQKTQNENILLINYNSQALNEKSEILIKKKNALEYLSNKILDSNLLENFDIELVSELLSYDSSGLGEVLKITLESIIKK